MGRHGTFRPEICFDQPLGWTLPIRLCKARCKPPGDPHSTTRGLLRIRRLLELCIFNHMIREVYCSHALDRRAGG